MSRFLPLIPLLLLCACATPEQIAAARQQQAAQDSGVCQSYGFRPGSEGFANCRLQLELAREPRYYYDPYPPPPVYGTYWHRW